MEDIVSKTDVELRTHYRELPSYLRLPASIKTPMLPHVCLFQYVDGRASRRRTLICRYLADSINLCSIQYHAHLILLHRPLVHKRKRRSVVGVDVALENVGDEGDEYANRHMTTCRDSAAEIARLLRVYKQQYTLVRSVPKTSLVWTLTGSAAAHPHRGGSPLLLGDRHPPYRRAPDEPQQTAGDPALADVHRRAARSQDGMVGVERAGVASGAAIGSRVVSV